MTKATQRRAIPAFPDDDDWDDEDWQDEEDWDDDDDDEEEIDW